MALEELAGPFAVTDGLSGEVMTQISGLGPWLDGYGLLVQGAFPTAFGGGMTWGVMTFDGSFAPLVHYNTLAYGLALIGNAADPSARTHWACVQQTYGGLNGEWDVDPFTFYAGTPSGFTDEAMASFYPFVRLHDRYLVAYWGQVRAKTAANHSGVLEATLPFDAYPCVFSWGDRPSEVVIGGADGSVCTYDWIKKTVLGSARNIGMTGKSVWYSAAAGVYISLHDTGPTVEARIWAKTVRPASISAPTYSPAPTSGKRSTVTARVVGSFGEPCVGEVVAWSLSGPGSLALAATTTDAAGFAFTYYDAPLDSAGEATITAEVAF